MRRVDDRRELAHAVHAEVGDRRRAALIFGGLELLRARARGQLLHLVGDRGQRLLLGVADHRRDQAAVDRHRDADVGMLEAQDAVAGPHRVRRRHALQGERQRLDDEVVDRELVGRFVALLRRAGVRLLAQLEQRVELDVHREIEMRDGLLGFGQPRGDGLAHAVERHFLVVDALVERLDLRGRRARRHCGPGRASRAARDRRLDVGRDDAAVRTRAAEPRQIDAALAGKPPRQRRDERPARELGRAEVALRRAHLEERVHRAGGLDDVLHDRSPPRAAGTQSFGPGFPLARDERSCAPLQRGAAHWPRLPAPLITATTAPTFATSPTCTLIAVSTPADVAGTSIEILSVSISNRLSPGFTASPADLNHFVILPSATVSPSCGIRTSIRLPIHRMYCVSRNSIRPSCAPSRPMPDCFMPPNGAAGSETRPRFSPIMPKSSFSETRMPRVRSLV